MSESNSNVIPAINAVDGFNPADFVRTTVGEEGENDLYLDVKYRLLWFRLHHPNGKIDPELIRVDEKNAIVCCRIYADKADPADQFIGKAYSQRFSTEDRFGDRFLEIAETVAKGRALADAGYGTQFCMNGETLASIIADAPIKMPPDEDAGHPGLRLSAGALRHREPVAPVLQGRRVRIHQRRQARTPPPRPGRRLFRCAQPRPGGGFLR